MTTKKQVAIIGGGLAGLSAAIHLQKKNIACDVFEKYETTGGRVASEYLNGYTLDKGFQVFLDSYEEASELIDLSKLNLMPAGSGAIVRINNKWDKFGNPLKNPLDIFETAISSVGSLKDKWLVFKLSRYVKNLNQEEINFLENKTTSEFLVEYGFSKRMITNFFEPFFGGVFLDYSLRTSSRLFLYLFKKFNEGDATLPLGGMAKLAEAMSSQLPKGSVHTNREVEKIDGNTLILDGGETKYRYDHVIIATNPSNAYKLDDSLVGFPHFNGTYCYYYSCDTLSIENASYLHLNPRGKHIRHVCILNRIQASYAPAGKDLLSITVEIENKPEIENLEDELNSLFDHKIKNLSFLKSYKIPEALVFYDGTEKGVKRNKEGHILCGDHTLYPSINAAIKSGRLAANLVSQ